VSSQLDVAIGGTLLEAENRTYVFHVNNGDETQYDATRRSIYLPVIRNHLYDVFSLFDYTDASMINGDRSTTTVAPQALFLMNSDFVVQATKKMAEQLLSEAQDVRSDEERIQELYRRAYGRPATTSEVEKAHAFLSEIERQIENVESAVARRLQAWQLFCQAIVSASEFVYVR